MYNRSAMESTLSPHVLFADSDALLCVTARRALQERHFSVTITHDGSEALDRFMQDAYDLVVLGLSLRLVDAVQVFLEIKKRDPDVPIIFLRSNHGNDITPTGNEEAFATLNAPITDWNAFSETLNQAIHSRRKPDVLNEMEQNSVPVSQSPSPDAIHRNALTLLRLLTDTTRNVTPLTETLDLLLQAAAQIMSTDHAALVLVEGDRQRMYRVLGARAPGHSTQDAYATSDDMFVLRVINARHTLVETDPARNHAQVIGTPLLARDQVLGVLLAYPLTHDPLAPEQLHWFEVFAAFGGVAVEIERLTGEYEQQLPTDAITETLKRAPFLDLADREFRRAWRYNQPITALYVHLDNLPEIRSLNGPNTAEQALKLAAQTCRSAIRSIDLLCRYEDDAFAVLLLMTTGGDARHVAERLRNGLAILQITHARNQVRVTASLGVCAYPREGCSSIFDMLAIAQEAQHAARRGGTNQIVYV